MKHNNKFIIITFLLIIFGVFLFYPIKYVLISKGLINFNLSDNWTVYTNTGTNKIGAIKDRVLSLENSINNRTSTYFPGYEMINRVFYQTKINTEGLISNDIFIKTNSDNEYLMYNKKNDFYYLYNSLSKEEMEERLDLQVSYYNDLATNFDDLNIYIYMPLRYELNNIDKERNLSKYVSQFSNGLNKKINIGMLKSESVSEYLSYFYKTDHHYNAFGALTSYYDIIEMMDMVDNNKYETHVIKDKYYGSMAKSALLNKTYDQLTDINSNMSVSSNIFDNLFKPRKIVAKNNQYYDYYVGYFNGQYDEIIYSSGKNTNRNLLIISDSLAWQIDYLLANHYDNTYVVNMRYGKWLTNDLSLSEYIKESKITDILFLQEAETQMFDVYDHLIRERVVK